MNWHAYERRKAAWIAANPHATPEEYEQAARGGFRRTRRLKAPRKPLRSPMQGVHA